MLKRVILSSEMPWILAVVVFLAPLFFFLVMASPPRSPVLVLLVFATWLLAVLIQGLRILLSNEENK